MITQFQPDIATTSQGPKDTSLPSDFRGLSANNSGHLHFLHHMLIRIEELMSNSSLRIASFPNPEQLRQTISGAGIYIGPESEDREDGFSPYGTIYLLQLQEQLLKSVQRLFPLADRLNLIGPEWQSIISYQPGVVISEFGFYHGIDSEWPEQLLAQKPKWGLSINLWDYAYYFIDTPLEESLEVVALHRYREIAQYLYAAMDPQAVLFVNTLMQRTPFFNYFMDAFRDSGWNVCPLYENTNDPILITKGLDVD